MRGYRKTIHSPQLTRLERRCPECGTRMKASGVMHLPDNSEKWSVEFYCPKDDEIFPIWALEFDEFTKALAKQEGDMPSSKPLPWYYSVNDRPVRMVSGPNGAMDVQVMNMKTGEFETNMDYLSKCLGHVGDVDELKEADFERLVEVTRADIRSRSSAS